MVSLPARRPELAQRRDAQRRDPDLGAPRWLAPCARRALLRLAGRACHGEGGKRPKIFRWSRWTRSGPGSRSADADEAAPERKPGSPRVSIDEQLLNRPRQMRKVRNVHRVREGHAVAGAV